MKCRRQLIRRGAALVVGMFLAYTMTAPLQGAVIYTDLPDIPVFQGDLFPATERLDLNSDGNWDVEFYAHDDIFRLSTAGSLEIVSILATPPDQGADLHPYVSGDFIGASPLPDGFDWNGGDAFFYGCALFGQNLVCLGLWGNGVNHLGFRIEEDDGFHYGYITVDTPFLGIHGGHIQGFAYESTPDTGIAAGAIPEPSPGILLCLGAAIYASRRTRNRRG